MLFRSKGSSSEFSYAGSTAAAPATAMGALLFGSAAGEAVVSKAGNEYNGDTIAANSTFQMNINGTKVVVTVATQITKTSSQTATTMSAAVAVLQTAVQTAVDEYNKQNGLSATGGVFDKASGLTSLDKNDFTVEAADDGAVAFTSAKGCSEPL